MKYPELKRMYDVAGPAETVQRLREAIEDKHIKLEEFSVRALAESLIDDGREWVRSIDPRKSGGLSLVEAAHAVDTSAFSNITGQLVFSRIRERFNDPAFLWPRLVETIQTTLLDGEKIPGVGRLGDNAEIVEEGMPYPNVGLSEEWIETAPTRKRGFIVPVTREIIVADRTGVLLRNAGEGGHWLGLNKEKRVLDVVLGVVNNYKRNGTATNTYLTSGAYINSVAAALSDWTDVEAALILFDALTDPNTGEPIDLSPTQVIVPTALAMTARHVLNATTVERVDNQTNATTYRTTAGNPSPAYEIISSPQVKARTNSADTWYIGDFRRAFAYLEVWDIETSQAPSNSEAEFEKDIMIRYKVSERGVAQVMEPRRAAKITAA